MPNILSMESENKPAYQKILPVTRSKDEARWFYNRISGVYDYVSGTFERKYTNMALDLLSVQEGETVLEIGCGTGHSLKRLAQATGSTGSVCGIDISSGMLDAARRRLNK